MIWSVNDSSSYLFFLVCISIWLTGIRCNTNAECTQQNMYHALASLSPMSPRMLLLRRAHRHRTQQTHNLINIKTKNPSHSRNSKSQFKTYKYLCSSGKRRDACIMYYMMHVMLVRLSLYIYDAFPLSKEKSQQHSPVPLILFSTYEWKYHLAWTFLYIYIFFLSTYPCVFDFDFMQRITGCFSHRIYIFYIMGMCLLLIFYEHR